MPTSKATAVWEGKLKDGNGRFSAASGSFGGTYTFATRFEGKKGATPEELIAAAHAACYSMALSAGLEKVRTPVTSVTTEAACTIETVDGSPKITTIALNVRAKVPGIAEAAFLEAAQSAKENCPVSKALKAGVAISLLATLET